MEKILITNNPLVNKKYSKNIVIQYFQISYLEILKKARDEIHMGSKLLTHPLSGSVKPNETPYKTLILLKHTGKLDMDSLMIIESSIATTQKFIQDKRTPNWNERILKDFQVIDLSLIEDIINKEDF